jgi:hypothetical protein
MSIDGSDTLVKSGAETPTTEVETEPTEVEQPVSLDPVEPDADDPEAEPDDHEEVDWNGKKFRIPKELKPGLMMQADYTKKTQEVAAEREALKAERQSVTQQAEAERANLADHAKLFSIGEELKAYENVDWQSFINDDPIGAQQHQSRLQQLEWQGRALAQKMQQADTERSQKAQQESAKRIEEGLREVQKIPGWNPEYAGKLKDYAKSTGFTDQEVNSLSDPKIVKLLHKAYVGEQVLAKQKKPAEQAPPVQPLATVAARGSSPGARKSLGEMSMEEYAASELPKRMKT